MQLATYIATYAIAMYVYVENTNSISSGLISTSANSEQICSKAGPAPEGLKTALVYRCICKIMFKC